MELLQPADLIWFLHVLDVAAVRLECFARQQLAFVESAWQMEDTVVSAFGWVVMLKAGTRHYVEYIMAHDHEVEIIEVTALAADQLVPELETAAEVAWYYPDHINRHLGLKSPN
jgi:hypothetical protein